MKTVIQGYEPNSTIPAEVAVESVYSTSQAGLVVNASDTLVNVRIGDKAACISLRELSAAVLGAERAVPPPGWTLQGLYGPNETVIPPRWPPRPY